MESNGTSLFLEPTVPGDSTCIILACSTTRLNVLLTWPVVQWSVGTMLTGLLSFMLESAATTGAVNASKAERQR